MPAIASKLKELAARAGTWLGRAVAPAARTGAIDGDKFDEMLWEEVTAQAAALRDLSADLHEHHDYAPDLLQDVFFAAYKTHPRLRDPAEMHPTRMVNHRIAASLLASPEFTELRRDTAGDQYAAAMAVLAQADYLRSMTGKSQEAQQAAQDHVGARQREQEAAALLRAALEQAQEQAGADGSVPDAAAQALAAAIDAAELAGTAADEAAAAAGQALDAASAAIGSAARQAAAAAAGEAREEAELMAAWGIDPGALQRMPFDQRRALASRLRGSRLGGFARLIGRFKIAAQGERARKIERAPGELARIVPSDDLSRLISSELAALGIPALRAPFWARYAERRLLTFQTRGTERAGRGAIIAVVDSSLSMSDAAKNGVSREAWSKALALALLDSAQAGRRDFAAILFGSASEIKVFRFPGGQRPATADVLDFTEFFFAGGTNFEVPLATAAELLEAEYNQAGKSRGDIVFMTDDECAVSAEWLAAWRDARARLGFRAFGIALGRRPGTVLGTVCDNVRGLDDLTGPDGARDIFRVT